MRWDEYVEDITALIRTPRRSREVRREIRDHLLCLRDGFLADGLPDDEAQDRAMEVLGPVDVLTRRFRDLQRPFRPLWPVAVTVAALLWAIGCRGIPGVAGTRAVLLLWAIAWGISHLRSFPSLAHALRTRPLASGIDWSQLFPQAWPFAGAGATAALAAVVLLSPAIGDLGFFGVLLGIALAAAALVAAYRRPWLGGEVPILRHPLTSGIAAVALLLVALIAFTLFPVTNPDYSVYYLTYTGPGLSHPSPPVIQQALRMALPEAGLLAALYFAGATIVDWLGAHLGQGTSRPGEEPTLTVE